MPRRPPIHRPAGWRDRAAWDRERRRDPKVRALYNSARWRHARRQFLEANPLCVACQRHGETRAAEVVDHIVPHAGDETRFWDSAGWQALCARCHNRKTAAQDGGFGNRKRCGASG